MLATREDIDVTWDNQRPAYKLPGLPHHYASDLKVPGAKEPREGYAIEERSSLEGFGEAQV